MTARPVSALAAAVPRGDGGGLPQPDALITIGGNGVAVGGSTTPAASPTPAPAPSAAPTEAPAPAPRAQVQAPIDAPAPTESTRPNPLALVGDAGTVVVEPSGGLELPAAR